MTVTADYLHSESVVIQLPGLLIWSGILIEEDTETAELTEEDTLELISASHLKLIFGDSLFNSSSGIAFSVALFLKCRT